MHKNWMGTDRVTTDLNGATGATYTSLPFGDGGSENVSESYAGWDFEHFGDMDVDSWDSTYHAQYRNYSELQARWLSPDPYDGSYDASNPQSFNRYAYVLNNPLSFTDPQGTNYTDSNGNYCLTWNSTNSAGTMVSNVLCTSSNPSPSSSTNLPWFISEYGGAYGQPGGQCLLSDGAAVTCPQQPTTKSPAPTKPAPNKPTKPCNDANNNRSRFFQQLPGLTSVAKQLNVPTNFIVGLSSFESGWFDNHNVALNNLWGLTQGGGNNIHFSSIQAGNNYFVSNVGPFIQGAQTQAAFFKGLQAEGYNSVNPNYYPTLANRINNIQSWGQACGVSF